MEGYAFPKTLPLTGWIMLGALGAACFLLSIQPLSEAVRSLSVISHIEQSTPLPVVAPAVSGKTVLVVGVKRPEQVIPTNQIKLAYALVESGCDYEYVGPCVLAYAGPSSQDPVTDRLRQNMVLKIGGQEIRDGEVWYQISFAGQWLRYPERAADDRYVNADDVAVMYDPGVQTSWENGVATGTQKRIIVDRSEQMLRAYNGERLFMETPISTGLSLTPTQLGTYHVFKKMPSRYMQGPVKDLPDDHEYDLPGVPWNLYFTDDGAVIHGAYWHDSFGSRYSHGCVNLPAAAARELYYWAPLGTIVEVIE